MDYSCRTYQLLGVNTSTRTTNKTESTFNAVSIMLYTRVSRVLYAVADCDRSYIHTVVIRVVEVSMQAGW